VAGRRGVENGTSPYYFTYSDGLFLKAAIFIDFVRPLPREQGGVPLPWPTGGMGGDKRQGTFLCPGRRGGKGDMQGGRAICKHERLRDSLSHMYKGT
jgi:hypothetical protein